MKRISKLLCSLTIALSMFSGFASTLKAIYFTPQTFQKNGDNLWRVLVCRG